MEENIEENNEQKAQDPKIKTVKVDGMYEDWFLDYASYVILERAVPLLNDGMKPVQRRILHAMKEMDDGRFHKVANVIGQTMQYHPHGDAAIGDALVKIGQKDLLIDCQGNWGDVRTGDSAAAARYIEARLTKFGLEVLFNKETTNWQLSYDGRKNEPIALPAKFPLLLAQGAEGIAVGLSTKIMPHNFIELIKGSIKILKGGKTKILPDFPTGGFLDATDYNSGKRGGKIRVRAKIESADKKTLKITEIPFGTTTSSLIDSVIKANDKGKIKIKKITDNTAKDVEIEIQLPNGVSPDVTIDALYAFTNCEMSISPNACLIIDDKPHFMTVDEVLERSTEKTKDLLRQELEIKQHGLNEKWHLSSLEKIFIENRIYRDIEECETWEAVIEAIDEGMHQYISTPSRPSKAKGVLQMHRDLTQDDILKLTEIKIKRISKFDSFKADEIIRKLVEELEEVAHHLANLTDFSIAYYERLLEKYGKGKERKTELRSFENISVKAVVANNAKLYVNRKEGFIGTSLRKEEFVSECSDIDDIIVFKKDGSMKVSRISDKTFVGKDIIHIQVWKKGDDRLTYHMIYADIKAGKNYVKRFNVTSITREKDYQLTKSDKAKVLYFAAHPNSESEVVQVNLSNNSKARVKQFEYDFADLAIKGRGSAGNVISKYPIRKVEQRSLGESTIGGVDIWIDKTVGRLNTDERGDYLGSFNTGHQILVVYKNGEYEVTNFELSNRYEMDKISLVEKLEDNTVVSCVYFDGENKEYYVKRFQIETKTEGQKFGFISEHRSSKLAVISTKNHTGIIFNILKGKSKDKIEEKLDLTEFIDVKGWRAQGNKLTTHIISGKIKEYEIEVEKSVEEEMKPENEKSEESKPDEHSDDKKFKPGDTIEFDF